MKSTISWEQAVKSAPDTYSIVTTIRRVTVTAKGSTFPRESVIARKLLDRDGTILFSEEIGTSEPTAGPSVA